MCVSVYLRMRCVLICVAGSNRVCRLFCLACYCRDLLLLLLSWIIKQLILLPIFCLLKLLRLTQGDPNKQDVPVQAHAVQKNWRAELNCASAGFVFFFVFAPSFLHTYEQQVYTCQLAWERREADCSDDSTVDFFFAGVSKHGCCSVGCVCIAYLLMCHLCQVRVYRVARVRLRI